MSFSHRTTDVTSANLGGVRIADAESHVGVQLQAWFENLDAEIKSGIRIVQDGDVFGLERGVGDALFPEADTTRLAAVLGIDPEAGDHLELEIMLAMLGSPVIFEFPSLEEFRAAVHIRRNIAWAARKTELAFDTAEAERPDAYWNYSKETGFTLKPGKSLIEALVHTTQPDASGTLYSFSCYRATEYVTLLGIAQELAEVNPALLAALERQWEKAAIMSRRFHETFLYEFGSDDSPVPARYYVPGDRVWFRNPDEKSAEVTGYEGSWVFYMGGGLFCNFWKHKSPYTLTSKCVEIFHWRDGVCRNESGVLVMDENKVDALTQQTLEDPVATCRVLETMVRFRDPSGISAGGGCIDTTREFPKRVCPGTADIVL